MGEPQTDFSDKLLVFGVMTLLLVGFVGFVTWEIWMILSGNAGGW